MERELTSEELVRAIGEADRRLSAQAARAVNVSLTLRNWMIGCYIAEFELHGADRAAYGDRLLTDLARELKRRQVSNAGRRQLYQYLASFRTYPQNVRALSAQSRDLLPPALRLALPARAPEEGGNREVSGGRDGEGSRRSRRAGVTDRSLAGPDDSGLPSPNIWYPRDECSAGAP